MIMRLICIVILLFTIINGGNAQNTFTVREAVKAAINNHPLGSAASAIVKEAEGELFSSISPSSPQFALEYEGTPQGSGLAGYEERRLSLSQEFEFPLKTMVKYRKGRTAVDRAKYEKRVKLLEIESMAREAYIEAWENLEKEKILAENAHAANDYASNLIRAQEIGEASLLDARRARVEALSAQQFFASARNGTNTALEKLYKITGLNPDSFDLVYPLEFGPENEVDSLYLKPAEESPEVKIAELEARVSLYERRSASIGWLPDFEISYFQQEIPSEDNPKFWGMEFGINLPIWFWWEGRGEIRAAKAREKTANANYSNAVLKGAIAWNAASGELKNSLNRYQLFTEELLPLAKQTYELAERSYTLGEADYLDVIQARRSYLDNELDFVEASAAIYKSLIQLDRLTGKSILN